MAMRTFVIQQSFSLIREAGAGTGWEGSKHRVRDWLWCPTVKGCGLWSGFGWRRGLGAESRVVGREWRGGRRPREQNQDWGKVVVTECQEVDRATESLGPRTSLSVCHYTQNLSHWAWWPWFGLRRGGLGRVREGLWVTQKWRVLNWGELGLR